MAPYEYFDHTADMGMRAYGRDLAELFSNGAVGMFGLMTSLAAFKPDDALDVLLNADNVEELFWKWLRELHYLFSTQKLVFKQFEFKELNEKTVWATCWGGYFDPARHPSGREVKAVTHHGFQVVKSENGWRAEVIFDL